MWQIYQNRLLNSVLTELSAMHFCNDMNNNKIVLRKAQTILGADHVYRVAGVEIKNDQGNIDIELVLTEKEQKNITIH